MIRLQGGPDDAGRVEDWDPCDFAGYVLGLRVTSLHAYCPLFFYECLSLIGKVLGVTREAFKVHF
jgi:hypothetical protein